MTLRRHNIDLIPGDIKGVYAFWCRVTRRCIYVGKTEDQSIKERLMQHWRGAGNKKVALWISAFGKFLDICYLPVKDGKIDRTETRLIHMWDPEINVQKKRR